MRGGPVLAALVALLVASGPVPSVRPADPISVLAVSTTSEPATAGAVGGTTDACTGVHLRIGAVVKGTALAVCVRTRMLRAGPGTTRITIGDGMRIDIDGRADPQAIVHADDRLARAIRSVRLWNVLGAELVGGVGLAAYSGWRLAPARDARRAVSDTGVVLVVTTEQLPVLFQSTLPIGRLRAGYLQQWDGWAGSPPLSCASCQSLGPPPTHS